MKENKAILTVIGCDRVGIIATVSTYLAEKKINILDITQTIMQDIFTMVMMVDYSECVDDFANVHDDLKAMGERLEVQIQMQRSEIFDSMHKI